MKTSNKLLTAGFFFLIVASVTGMIVTKNNMMQGKKSNREGNGNGIMKTVTLADRLTSDHLFLESNYEYVLDTTHTVVRVTSDENLVDQIKMSQDRSLRLYREGDLRFRPSAPVRVVLGIAGQKNLTIEAKDRAILTSNQRLQQNLMLTVEDRAFAELEILNDSIVVATTENGTCYLLGETGKLNLTAEDNSDCNLEKMRIADLDTRITDSAAVKMDRCETILAILDNKAKLEIQKKWRAGKILSRGQSKVYLKGEQWEKSK